MSLSDLKAGGIYSAAQVQGALHSEEFKKGYKPKKENNEESEKKRIGFGWKINKGKISSRKPKVKIKEVKSSSLLKSFANEKRQLVKEVPERVYANDNRSLFFNNEMDRERKNLRRF